jgi:hypothetical protein
MTPNTEQWTEVKEADRIVRFETPGQSVKGVFRGGAPAGNKGSQLYKIEGSDGTTQKVWETFALKDQLAAVPVGRYVEIVYTGLSGKMKKFAVRHRPV